MEQLKTLEFKGLWHHLVSDIVEMIGCLTQLSDLRLIHFISHKFRSTDFVEIVRCAPKLQYFEVVLNQTFDVDLYLQIVELVRNREEYCHLELKMHWYGYCSVHVEFLKANPNFLKIVPVIVHRRRPYTV